MKAAALFLLSAVALFACSDAFSPPPDLPYSRVTYICSWTGPGHIAIWVRPRFAALPFVYLAFPDRPPGLQNGAWVAPSDSAIVEYWTATAPDEYEPGSGTITITSAGGLGSSVLGKIDLQFGAKHISGDFRAEWEEPPVC